MENKNGEEVRRTEQIPDITMQEKPRFNTESFSLMIFFIFAMYFISVTVNVGGNLIQKILLGIWLIIIISVLHKSKKFSLFGDNFPTEETTKLTTMQKILIWIFGIISPAITAIIVTIIWHSKNPFRARRANVIAMILFSAEFLIGLLAGTIIAGR